MSSEQYNPNQLETAAQEFWEKNQTFKVKADLTKEKYYCLSMFPYPSGNIHIGHVRNYTIGDVISRYQRMLGKNVLQPFGWDAFGLPAENAAIANKSSPAPWTYSNIDKTREQIKSLGFSYDWFREITTCKPDYYRWEQWFFTRLFEQGIAYKKPSVVNWCDVDKTVLANEQVVDGCCWRCDTKVRQIELNQWFLATSKFSQELLDGLQTLDQWPEQVKAMQENWIGRSEGLEVEFNVENVPVELQKLKVFTTRADTFYGVSYVAIAATHPLSLYAAQNNFQLAQFVEETKHVKTAEADLATMEKLGVDTGIKVKHPLTEKLIPIYTANFVLMTYGTGAVMAVAAHDERDYEFAIKYNLPILPVIKPIEDVEFILPYCEDGELHSSGQFDGLIGEEGRKAIGDHLVKMGIAEWKVNYRLRDWGLSRQRYWGTPIPMLHLENGEIVSVPDEQLPVVLPENVILNGVENPLVTDESWNKISYKGQPAIRETDTFDTFMESSWYYARYTSPNCDTAMLDPEEANYWLPVDQYIGGVEHATMHLIYSRFYHKLLRNNGLVKSDEPFTKLVCQGMVLNNSYYYLAPTGERVWVNTNDVSPELDDKGRIIGGHLKNDGTKCIYAGMTKMSKSKNNGVDPTEMIELYGADALRLFVMFAAPIESTLEWRDSGIEGANRFLRKLWKLTLEFVGYNRTETLNKSVLTSIQQKLRYELHRTIVKVNDDISRRQNINTAIASIMELLNHLIRAPLEDAQDFAIMQEALNAVVLMLYPITPHICLELWKRLGNQDLIDFHPIAQHDESALLVDNKLIIVQVNGKLRAKFELPSSAGEEEVKAAAHNDPAVQKYISEGTIVKEIYVANKLYNIVVK